MQEVLSLSQVTADHFSPFVGSIFLIHPENEPTFELSLTEVISSKHQPFGNRQPFILSFSGTPGVVLPQQIYRLTHPELGELEIFIVPVGATPDSTSYEAIFS